MNIYSAYNAISLSRLKPLAVIFSILAVALLISISITPKQSTQYAANTKMRVRSHSVTQDNNITDVLGYRFSDRDLLIYKQINDAQDKGQWDAADELITQLSDDTLLGDILAKRYLSKTYQTSFSELMSWLKNYGDMPVAPRVVQLARKKQPSKTSLPNISAKNKHLAGVGIRDGLGGEVMPAEWQEGLKAWMKKDYSKAAQIFTKVANASSISPWHQSAGHFWAYRAHKAAGKTSQAMQHLQAAAKAPFTLYGALARHALGSDELLKAELPALSLNTLQIMAVKRAAMYSAMGDDASADNELRHLYSQSPLNQKMQLITIADALNLPALQLRMSQMIYRKAHGSNAAAYPIPRWLTDDELHVDPALIFAIARQESGFNPNAKSPAGAMGVMQVMPKTANYVIKQYKLNEVELAALDMSNLSIQNISARDMNNPQVNLTVAQHYLHYLSEKPYINGDIIRLLAAYNAGPANVIEWNKRFADIDDPLLFIEMIPFRETRHYVKQVMSNYVIYDELINAKRDETFTLIKGEWPHLSISDKEYASN